MDAAGIFSGLMMLLTGVGATIVLVIQAKSATRIAERIAEVKSVAEATQVVAKEAKVLAVETKVVADQVHTLTNSTSSENRALITKQVDQIEAMRRDATVSQTRHAADVAALVAQLSDMKTLMAKMLPTVVVASATNGPTAPAAAPGPIVTDNVNVTGENVEVKHKEKP